MKKKIVGIFICMLLMGATVLTVAGNVEQSVMNVENTNTTQEAESTEIQRIIKPRIVSEQDIDIETEQIVKHRQLERIKIKPNPDPGHIKDALGDPAQGGESEIYVYPRCQHGIKRRDVTNVQWAVDNIATGGTVHLMTTDPDGEEKKAFYFGLGDFGVKVRSVDNIIIKGESSEFTTFKLPRGRSIETDRAIIYGGFRTIALVEKLKLDVENIHIENPKDAGIWVTHSNGINVSNCKIFNVRPYLYSWGYCAVTISLYNTHYYPDQEVISGYANIMNNELSPNRDLKPSYYNKFLQGGIWLSCISCDAYIYGNTIYNADVWTISVDQNMGNTTVEDNILNPGPAQADPSISYGMGILVGYHWYLTAYQGNLYVKDNKINATNPYSPFGCAIAILGYLTIPGTEFEFIGNELTVYNTMAAVISFAPVDNFWDGNIFKGYADYAVLINDNATNGVYNLAQSELDEFEATNYYGWYVLMLGNSYGNTIDAPDIPCYRFFDLSFGANTINCE